MQEKLDFFFISNQTIINRATKDFQSTENKSKHYLFFSSTSTSLKEQKFFL